jgi:hypothetical protein
VTELTITWAYTPTVSTFWEKVKDKIKPKVYQHQQQYTPPSYNHQYNQSWRANNPGNRQNPKRPTLDDAMKKKVQEYRAELIKDKPLGVSTLIRVRCDGCSEWVEKYLMTKMAAGNDELCPECYIAAKEYIKSENGDESNTKKETGCFNDFYQQYY